VRTLRSVKRTLLLMVLLTAPVYGQHEEKAQSARVDGTVRNSAGKPIAGAAVVLEAKGSADKISATTDTQGRFHFDAVRPASYVLRVTAEGYETKAEELLALHADELKTCSFVLVGDTLNAVQFSDEPAFTVAGVTDVTEYGSHGSAPFMHNRDEISKQAVSLGDESAEAPHSPSGTAGSIRAQLAKEDRADLRVQLAEIEEREGHPLEAVRDYQRAAEMQPSEAHQFVWGAELLLHHTYEPAIIVFTQGRRLYPDSTRMRLGLAAATYASGTPEAAEKILLEACDRDPSNPMPYMFLGKLQALENIDLAAWVERMKRFVTLHPESAMAHYLYAVALQRQRGEEGDSSVVESQLKTAVTLDPHLGDAYLQLGILYTDRHDFPGALRMLQRAVELMPSSDQAHYRLAQIYRQAGEPEKARKEIEQFKQITEQKDKQAGPEGREIQRFVYTLRNPASSTTPSNQQ